MSQLDDQRDTELVDPTDEETLERARCTVARHALDAADCADLLDMLGLRDADAVCSGCHQSMSRLSADGTRLAKGSAGLCGPCSQSTATEQRATERADCGCGRPLPAGETQCGTCRRYVDPDIVCELVAKLQADLGIKIGRIATLAGASETNLRSIIRGRRGVRGTDRHLYERLLEVPEILAAIPDGRRK